MGDFRQKINSQQLHMGSQRGLSKNLWYMWWVSPLYDGFHEVPQQWFPVPQASRGKTEIIMNYELLYKFDYMSPDFNKTKPTRPHSQILTQVFMYIAKCLGQDQMFQGKVDHSLLWWICLISFTWTHNSKRYKVGLLIKSEEIGDRFKSPANEKPTN